MNFVFMSTYSIYLRNDIPYGSLLLAPKQCKIINETSISGGEGEEMRERKRREGRWLVFGRT